MEIKSILLRNFRNYQESEILWHPNLNLIYGKNAQGKTNLLEAIAYLSLGSSFREQKEEKLKNWEADFFYLAAELSKRQVDHSLSVGFSQKKRLWKKDGIPCRKTSEIAGFLHTVVFTPEDLEIVKKGPEMRRNFLDREMVQLFRGYHLYLVNYKKALLQRNNLLKQIKYEHKYSGEQSLEQLLPWENQLIKSGAKIIYERAMIIARLNIIAGEIHEFLSQKQEKLELIYNTCVNKVDLTAAALKMVERNNKIKEIEVALQQEYGASRSGDLEKTQTTIGPQRDDFKILISGIDARSYGSQGQQRTAALAIKLSEVQLVYELKGYYPILLLDDVLSELDHFRRQALLRLMLNKSQIFITTTDIKEELQSLAIDKYYKYFVEGGTVIRE